MMSWYKTVNIADVIALNKFLLGDTKAITEQGRRNADTDSDDVIGSTDALNILKYAIKLLTELPV